MILSDFFDYLKVNPKYAILLILIVVLSVYQQYVNEALKNPQKKEKPLRPKLPIKPQKKATGIIFGRIGRKVMYSPIEDEGHVICIAGSGGGKTSGVCIPSIRSACQDPKKCTCFCIDISGDISSNCTVPNKLLFNIEDEHTIPYNIFAEIDNEPNVEIQNELLDTLSFLIMPDKPGAEDAAAYFLSNGRDMLIGSLIAFYHQGLDFVPICKKILSMDYVSLLNAIVDTKNNAAIDRIASFSGCNEKNTSESKKCLDQYIKLYATNFRMANAVRRPKENELCITPQALKDHNVFLQIPDEKTDIYGPLLGICSAQAFHYCAARKNGENPTILFVLDEFASLQIDAGTILAAIRKYRKKRVRVMLLTQSVTDLDYMYGSGHAGSDVRKIILANIKYSLVLGSTDPNTQCYFSDLCGKQEIRTKSTNFSINSSSISYGAKESYRVPPEAFGQLNGQLYLICSDGRYQKLKTNYYFKYDK